MPRGANRGQAPTVLVAVDVLIVPSASAVGQTGPHGRVAADQVGPDLRILDSRLRQLWNWLVTEPLIEWHLPRGELPGSVQGARTS